MNKEKLSYCGKKVFIGIDVHKDFFVMTAVCDKEIVKTCRLPACAETLIAMIRKYFEGADVMTCYEAGFSGFALHRELAQGGINNLVIHAASVEIGARDKVKTDKRDSKKLAVQLESGRLRSIRIPSEEEEQARLISRTREQIVKSITRTRQQIRMKLHQFGLMSLSNKQVLTRKKVKEILSGDMPTGLRFTVHCLLSAWDDLHLRKLELNTALVKQAETDPYEQTWRSIPGIGPLSSRILSNELGDMSQFANERGLFSFTGLTPGEFSSGTNIRRGHISRQGSSRLRHILVEAAWRAIRKDEVLRADFERISVRAGKKRAIVAIARKLAGRARAVFSNKEMYQLSFCKAA